MRNTTLIILGVLIIAVVFYFLVWKDMSTKTTPVEGGEQSEPKPKAGPELITPSGASMQLGARSVKIDRDHTAIGQNPSSYYANLSEGNAPGKNVLTSKQQVYPAIHFEVSFNDTCSPYIWYRSTLYKLLGSETDSQGNKTCYYRYDASIFPSELRMQLPFGKTDCSNYKYYVSGIEYVHKETKVETSNSLGALVYCYYTKK